MRQLSFFFIAAMLLGASCRQEGTARHGGEAPSVQIIETPCREGGEPNLYLAEDGSPLLSWLEYLDDTTDVLYLSRLEAGRWAAPLEIARGSNWFVNWADFPSLSGFGGGHEKLAAHWLAMAGEGTYDYDVQIAVSQDGGKSWGAPFAPHQDGVKAEHGFVSLLPTSDTSMFAAWLDGRNTKTAGFTSGHGHGAMSLRGGFFSLSGKMLEEQEIDGRVCDCCQTDAARIPGGLIVAYRGRSEEEIRDIFVARRVDGHWLPPARVHDDQWKITGCPVNGPALATREGQVALAWYTAAQDTPRVMLAFSQDGGAHFGRPARLDGGKPLGRVDAAWLDDRRLAVSWMEEVEDEAEIRIFVADKQGAGKHAPFTLARNSKARSSGFPLIEAIGEGELLAAWTQADSLGTTVKTAIVKLN